MPLAGRKLTIDEALALCYFVGWRSGDLVTAVAIMTAESGRYTEAWHINADASIDRGLFQINSIHELVEAEAFNPVKNAKYAYQLSINGTRWTPWAVYNHGTYKQYLSEIRAVKLYHPWRWKRLVADWEAVAKK